MKMNLDKIKKDNSAVTLIEILVAMMIFGFIIGGIVLFGVRAIEAHAKSQAMQNALENARFAIESMSKRMRTSSELAGGGNEVFFHSNVDGNDYCYKFELNALQVASGTGSDCSSLGGFNNLIGDANVRVDGIFEVKDSFKTLPISDPNDDQGMVRTIIKINYAGKIGVQSEDEVIVQSTVSLRDY